MINYKAKPELPRLNPADPLARSLAGYWAFADRGTAPVNLVTGLGGAVNTGASWSSGPWGRELATGGGADVTLEPAASLGNFGAADFTLAILARTLENMSSATGVLLYKGAFGNSGWYIQNNGGFSSGRPNSIGLAINTPTVTHVVSKTGVWTTGQRSLIVFTRAGSVGKVYVDGVDATDTAASEPAGSPVASSSPLRLGNYGTFGLPFNGSVSMVAMWSGRALSPDDVLHLTADPFVLCRRRSTALRYAIAALDAVPTGPIGVSLTQTPDAAHPDRPGVGLRATLNPAGDGQYLVKDLGGAATRLHTRLAINPTAVTGGAVAFLRGMTDGGTEAFRLRYNSTGPTVSAVVGSQSITAAITPALTWQAAEFKLDTSGSAELWINGVSVGSLTGDYADLAVRELWIGAPLKSSGTTGQLDLDEWAISDDSIGPVRVTPTSRFADDPARWLVVYNSASADSVAWAMAYHAARGVPLANLLGLPLSTDEQISEADFVTLRQRVADYLALNDPAGDVIGVLLGHTVPGSYTRTDNGQSESIAGQLQKIDGFTTTFPGPFTPRIGIEPVRPEAANLGGTRMTARIDGPDLATSLVMIDRATAIHDGGITGVGAAAKLWLDPWADPGFGDPSPQDWATWATGVGGGRLRVPIELSATQRPDTDVQFTTITDDGFFWGWAQADPPAGFFGSPAGQRVFAFQASFDAITCPTLRTNNGWAAAAIAAGYAATAGSTRWYTESAKVEMTVFFEALRLGWTLAEAWCAASPGVRSGLALVGDPLLTVRFPRAGWNVYGPIEEWAGAGVTEPIAVLRDDEQSVTIPAAARPIESRAAMYVIRHMDSQEREEAGVVHVRVMNTGGAAVSTASGPAWPSAAGWTPVQRGGAWEVRAWWGARFGELGVAQVQLVEQAMGGSEAVVAAVAVKPGESSVSFTREPGGATVRYTLRVVSEGGATEDSPWSGWVMLVSGGGAALTLV